MFIAGRIFGLIRGVVFGFLMGIRFFLRSAADAAPRFRFIPFGYFGLRFSRPFYFLFDRLLGCPFCQTGDSGRHTADGKKQPTTFLRWVAHGHFHRIQIDFICYRGRPFRHLKMHIA
ncbi:hypothetical protein WDV76_16745 [Xenorhabdus griffiniae]